MQQKENVQQNRQAVWQISGSHSGRTEHYCDSSLVLILQHGAVLWLQDTAINWLWIHQFATQMISAEEQALLLLLQTSQAGPSATSVCIYRQPSVFWQQIAVCIRAVWFHY